MSIYLDISAAVNDKAGLCRYASNLARALLRQSPGRLTFFYNRTAAAQVPGALANVPARSVRLGYKPWRMAVWLAQAARLGFNSLVPGCELFHATEHLLLPLRGLPTVLTVHDLIFHLYPQYHKRLNYWYLNRALPLFCRRADAIICVSENTKQDLMRCWGIDAAKISVIYEAADPNLQPATSMQIQAVRACYGLPERFMLYVGTIEPRKNLDRLLDALAILRRAGEDVHLVIVGAKGWLYEDFMAKLEAFEHRQAVLLPGYIPDSDLAVFYSAARLCVNPSIYEGFGLQVLEAMACGAPVVCSRTASLPEVGGDAARYFDPLDAPDMAEALRTVWQDADLRDDMREKGLSWVMQFSWKRAAQETMAVYEALLKRSVMV